MNMLNLKVEFLTPNDFPIWTKLYRQYADFYQVNMDENILDTLEDWLFDDTVSFYSIVIKDDKNNMLGFMNFREMLSPLRGKKVCFLDDLFVVEEVRGTQSVYLLFKELKKISKENSWSLIRWITDEENYRARKVYDKIATRTSWLTYQIEVN